jgi:hypothetical protein
MIRKALYDGTCFAIGLPLGLLWGWSSAIVERLRNGR